MAVAVTVKLQCYGTGQTSLLSLTYLFYILMCVYLPRYTTDACFISQQWHIRSIGYYILSLSCYVIDQLNAVTADFIGTVIGVFLVVITVEFIRRFSREYDRRILRERKSAIYASSQYELLKLPAPAIKRFR